MPALRYVNVYHNGSRNAARKMYAILDEQSNRSLVRSEFFNIFNDDSVRSPYTLKTCAGITETTGRRACGYTVESIDQKVNLQLPTLVECEEIPDNRSEIPTPNAASHHKHLKAIASKIPPLDPNANILLLLGRDILRVHKVRKQINGPHNAPFAQKLDLGWVVIGDVCLGKAQKPSTVSSLRTCILDSGCPSYLSPCESHLPSIDEQRFIQIMDREVFKDSANSWVAPLPFQMPRRRLPNNRGYTYKRLKTLCNTLEKNPEMKAHYLNFIQKMLDNDHAELAPVLQDHQERWYLPSFGVYHPRKPSKICIVFDSSAHYDGVSLNNVLLTGPDLNNSLLRVLVRFRKEPH